MPSYCVSVLHRHHGNPSLLVASIAFWLCFVIFLFWCRLVGCCSVFPWSAVVLAVHLRYQLCVVRWPFALLLLLLLCGARYQDQQPHRPDGIADL